MTTQRSIKNWYRGAPLAAGIAAAALLAAACSSSSTSGTRSDTSSASAATTSSNSAGSTGSNSASGPVAAADAFLKPYLTAPTTLPVTAPLKAKPTAGKTIVYIACELPQCTDITHGVQDAAAAVGWNAKILPFKSVDPATQIAAMEQALQLKPAPDYVVISGLPQAIWGALVPKYKAAKIPLIALAVGQADTGDTVIANLQDDADSKLQGKILGSWIVSDSGGTARVLQQDVPAYPTIAGVGTGIRDTLSSSCPGCKVTRLDITPAQLAQGGTVPAIVSALQRDPSIKYVAVSDIPIAVGLSSALKAAGLKDVKIVGGYADGAAVQSLSNGTGSAFTATNTNYQGWLAVDVAVRHADGQSVPPNDGGMPEMLLLPNNAAASGAPTDFPPNYKASFKTLWQVS